MQIGGRSASEKSTSARRSRTISAATCHLFAGGDLHRADGGRTGATGKFGLFDVLPVRIARLCRPLFGGRAVAQQFEPMLRELISERRSEDYAGSKDDGG